MEVKNLMIGDWYFDKELLKARKFHQLQFAESFGNPTYELFLEPIPLTEEILKANGFDYDWEDGWEYKGKDYEPLIACSPKDNFVSIDYNGCSSEYNISYVHQLQHALRLCGLNNLAENFKLE